MPIHRQLLPLIATLLLAPAAPAAAQDGGLAKIKEQELEAVRERISDLKESMDRRAGERDRITSELQEAEVALAEKRGHLEDIERQLAQSRA